MQKALCNATAEATGHTHICNMDAGHKGKMHLCRCGTMFIRVKKAELDKPLKKAQ